MFFNPWTFHHFMLNFYIIKLNLYQFLLFHLFFFSQTIKIWANFLRNSLLHRNIKLFIFSILKIRTKWERLRLNTKILKSLKTFQRRYEAVAPLWRYFPKHFKAVSNPYIATKQRWQVLNLESCIFLGVWKIRFFVIFQKIWRFRIPCDVTKFKIGSQRAEIRTLYSGNDEKIKFNNYGFSKLVINFRD